MCRRFTGPHSVLQVFLEKIISSISQIAETHRLYSEKTLCLWNEERVPIEATLSTQGQIDLANSKSKNQGTETSLLITKKNNQPAEIVAGKAAQQESEQQFHIVMTPKPLLENIESYNQFFEEVLDEFDLIIHNCAAKISKHFTKLTAVINENNQYEFPSVEIHKSVIDRLILNDSKHFKKLLTHVRTEFKTHEALIREKYPHCAENIDRLWKEVNLLRKDQINIDHYMSDLRRHALEEYNELYLRET